MTYREYMLKHPESGPFISLKNCPKCNKETLHWIHPLISLCLHLTCLECSVTFSVGIGGKKKAADYEVLDLAGINAVKFRDLLAREIPKELL